MKKTLLLIIFLLLGTVAWAQTVPDGLEWEIVGRRSVTITGYTGNATTLDIPDQIQGLPVTSVDDMVFFSHRGLISITIPFSVTAIGIDSFSYCSRLTSITVDMRNPAYISVDGVLFDKSMRTILAYPAGKQGAYAIPPSITSIGEAAFRGCGALISITIPSSVISIGSQAFAGCWSLASVSIPSSVTSIGDSAFSECSDLTSVSIPSSVTSIGVEAFFGCWDLTSISIPSSVTSIGDYAFAECTSLTSVTIPSSVTSIGISAFRWCRNLAGITVDSGNPAYASVDGVLFDKAIQTLIAYPVGKFDVYAYAIPSSVRSIGEAAFSENRALSRIIIPPSVTDIGHIAFVSCTNISSVTIPSSVTVIGDDAFWNCTGLSSVTISRHTQVGKDAFPDRAEIKYRD
jgi:hypothetical protein